MRSIHYHPADEAAGTEWVELRSLQGVDVDISGWRIEGGSISRFRLGRSRLGAAPDPVLLQYAGVTYNPRAETVSYRVTTSASAESQRFLRVRASR